MRNRLPILVILLSLLLWTSTLDAKAQAEESDGGYAVIFIGSWMSQNATAVQAMGAGQAVPAMGAGQAVPAMGAGQAVPAMGAGQAVPAMGAGQADADALNGFSALEEAITGDERLASLVDAGDVKHFSYSGEYQLLPT